MNYSGENFRKSMDCYYQNQGKKHIYSYNIAIKKLPCAKEKGSKLNKHMLIYKDEK